MYLLNTQTTILWVIEKTDKVLSDLHLVITDPNGDSTYGPIGYLQQPSLLVRGFIIQQIIPDIEGLWNTKLVKGGSSTYTVIQQVTMYVLNNTTIVKPLNYSDGSLNVLN